jgi:putative ubiquitin-RnfH superfamily antitoxin RatB of RatAB toxin-antitoxin module
MADDKRLECEVAYALADRQEVVHVSVAEGATVIDVLRASRLLERFPEIDAVTVKLGVFGQVVAHDHVVVAGDRVEIYRPLTADPRAARRARARRKS